MVNTRHHWLSPADNSTSKSKSKLCYDRRSVGQSVLVSSSHVGPKTRFVLLSVAVLLIWGALSDEEMGLSIIIVDGPRQRSHFRVRLPWDSRPYFTVSNSRFPFSSPPTTRKVTVEVFDPASTREVHLTGGLVRLCSLGTDHTENTALPNNGSLVYRGISTQRTQHHWHSGRRSRGYVTLWEYFLPAAAGTSPQCVCARSGITTWCGFHAKITANCSSVWETKWNEVNYGHLGEHIELTHSTNDWRG
jgi:hypothetical protein